MKKWPAFDNNGDLPVGIHQATLAETIQHFGAGTPQRERVGQQLERIFKLANSTWPSGEIYRVWFICNS